MTDPTPVIDNPAPVPEPPALNSIQWWTALGTVLGGFVVAVAVLIGHPIKSATVMAVVPSVAIVAASVSAMFMHKNVVMVKLAQYNAQVTQHAAVAQARLSVEQRRALRAVEPEPVATLLESVELHGNSPDNPMFVTFVPVTAPPSQPAPAPEPTPAKTTRRRAN